MFSLITAPFYFLPLYYASRKGLFRPSVVFFFYTLLGCWLVSFLLDFGLVEEDIFIAPWIVRSENIPWMKVALTNSVVFLSYKFWAEKRQRPPSVLHLPAGSARFGAHLAVLFIILASELSLIYVAFDGFDSWVRSSYARTIIEDSRINLVFPVILVANVYCLILFATSKGRVRTPRVSFSLAAALFAQLAVLLLSGGRSLAFLFLTSAAIIHYQRFRARYIWQLTLLCALIVIGSGLIIHERYKAQGADAQFAISTPALIGAAYTGLPFIDHIALAEQYAARVGNDYGTSYANAAMSFIPRALWPDKPIQLSRKVRETFYGDSEGGIPPGLFGEAVIALGDVGLFLVGIAFGALLGRAERYCSRPVALIHRKLRVAIVATLVGFVLVRGGVDIGIYRVGIIFAAFVLLERWMIGRFGGWAKNRS